MEVHPRPTQRHKQRQMASRRMRNHQRSRLPWEEWQDWLLVACVLIVCIHLVYGISFLTEMGMPFAGALKEYRVPVGIAVVGMLIGAAAFAKKLRASGKEKAS
mmetsp:Transcript_7806/g.14833  ORF Transcript_7806/g.14833 Transcript_7806/m.14833 type:complete len:103 (+) Transcript_7806:189-497(+)